MQLKLEQVKLERMLAQARLFLEDLQDLEGGKSAVVQAVDFANIRQSWEMASRSQFFGPNSGASITGVKSQALVLFAQEGVMPEEL